MTVFEPPCSCGNAWPCHGHRAKPALESLIREWFPYMSEDEVNELAQAARAAAAEEY